MNQKQREMQEIMKETLQDEYLHFSLESFRVEERLESEAMSRIVAQIRTSNRQDCLPIEGEGSGALHAFFLALRDRLGEEYPSIKAIQFTEIRAKSLPLSRSLHPTEAEVEVSLALTNSYGDPMEFVARSRSLIRATLEGFLQGVEYFVNSEKTYIRLFRALEHYRTQGRSDLIDKYTSLLTMVVRNTSYTEIIDRIKTGLV